MSSSGRGDRFWAGDPMRPHTPVSVCRAENQVPIRPAGWAKSVEVGRFSSSVVKPELGDSKINSKLCNHESHIPTFLRLSGRNCPCEHLRTSANTKNEQNPHHCYIEVKTEMKTKNTSGRCLSEDRHFLMRRGHNAKMSDERALFGQLIFSRNIYIYI